MKKMTVRGLLLLTASVWASPLFDQEKAKAERLMQDKKWIPAIKLLKDTKSNFQNEPKELAEIQFMLAVCQNAAGQYADALKTLEGINTFRPLDWQLEQAKSFMGQKKYSDAVRATEYYSEKNAEYIYLPALWLRANALNAQELYRECMKACQIIMQTAVKINPEGLADYKLSRETYEELKKLNEKARELYYEAREAYDIKVYGRDFAIYRKAREAQFREQYKLACDLYAKIKDGTLKDAAGCYTGECLVAMGDKTGAQKLYAKLLKDSPLNLYRGEILYSLAIMQYLENRAQPALKSIEELRTWGSSFGKKDASDNGGGAGNDAKTCKLENINEALKRDIIDTAPRTFLQTDNCGNLIPTAKYPESINNPLTSPWYLPGLKVKGELLYGFLLGESHQARTAAKTYREAESVSTMQIISDKNAISNLQASIASGSYLFSQSDERRLREFANHIKLASFYYVCGDRPQAENIFDMVMTATSQKKNSDDYIAASLGKAYCLVALRKNPEAMKLLDGIVQNTALKNNQLFPDAKYLRACILAQNKLSFDKAHAEFQELYKDDRSQLAPLALLVDALGATNQGKPDVAKASCEKLLAKYRSSPLSKPAYTLLEAIKKRSGQSRYPVEIVSPGPGKVVLHHRIIVISSTTGWEYVDADLSPADIILYQLKFVPKDNCQIVRSVWMDLEPGEPYPPTTVGDEICFVRAPILFKKALQYDISALQDKQKQ